MNLTQLLHEQAGRNPRRTAILSPTKGGDETISLGKLAQDVAQIGTFLKSEGFQPGDRILVMVPICPDLYRILLGLFAAGLTATFIDPAAGRKQIAAALEVADPVAFIGTPKAQLLRLLIPGLRRCRAYTTGFSLPLTRSWRGWHKHAPSPEPLDLDPETPALLTFTSGSTGQPKAAVRTHAFLLRQNESLTSHLPLVENRFDLATLPIFVLSNLARGIPTLLPDADLRAPGWIEPEPVIRQIEKHHPATTVASPAFLRRLMDSGRGPVALRSMQTIYTGGAPIWPDFVRQGLEMGGAAEWIAVYGSTEVEPIAHLSFTRYEEKINHPAAPLGLPVGRPIEDLQVMILPDRWGIPYPAAKNVSEWQPLGRGMSGEIVVSGPHVLGGYLNGEGDAESLCQLGDTIWRRLGDAGLLDEEGDLWLLGRCAAGYRREGMATIYPFPVELVARQFDWVQQAAMVTTPQGPRLALQVVGQPSPDELELLRTRLGHTFGEDFPLSILPAIPLDKRHNAKIDYPALRRAMKL